MIDDDEHVLKEETGGWGDDEDLLIEDPTPDQGTSGWGNNDELPIDFIDA